MATYRNDDGKAASDAVMTALIFSRRKDFQGSLTIERALHEELPGLDLDPIGGTEQAPLFTFIREGLFYSVMCMDGAAPIGRDDAQLRNAWFWPQAWDEVGQHRSHIVASVGGGSDSRQRALAFQRLLGVLLAADDSAIALTYIPSGTLLTAPMARSLLEDNQVALLLFVSCYIAGEAKGAFASPGLLAFTKGLGDLGVMEIEARGFVGEVRDLHQFILGFAEYLFQQAPTIKDGDTIGVSEDEKIRIKIIKSMFYDEQVYGLYFQDDPIPGRTWPWQRARKS